MQADEHGPRWFNAWWFRQAATAALSLLLFLAFYAARPAFPGFGSEQPVHRVNRAAADASLVLLSASLAIGPLARLWRAARHALAWRREAGIWGTIAAGLHVAFYWQMVYGWDWRPFFYRSHFTDGGFVAGDELARTGFAIGNWIGLLALLYAVVLAVTSNDLSQRLLRGGWSWLMQRATTMQVLVLLHTWVFAYLVYRGTKVVAPLLWTCLAVVLALQTAGFVATVLKQRRTARAA